MPIRVLKGIYMSLMFLIFALGILIELIFFFPIIWIITKLYKKNIYPMQSVHRKLFTIWLFLMRAGGLLKEKPIKGNLLDGPCIIIANHPGLFDIIFLIREIPRMSVMVKRALTKMLPLGPIFKLSGYILSPGTGFGSPVKSLIDASEKLKEGYKFMIFPEGTRSPVGGLRNFTPGTFKIAQKLNVPIQPVLIRNTPPFLPKGAPWYLPPKEISEIEIEYFEPITPPQKSDIKEFVNKFEKFYHDALDIPYFDKR